MTRRTQVGWTYFAVEICTLLLRVASALDIYSALNISDSDAFFSCVVQIAIFGFVSMLGYWLSVWVNKDSPKEAFSALGIKKISIKGWLLIVPICICTMVVSTGISFVWQMTLRMIGFTHISSQTDYASIGVLFKELALVALLPGVFEELSHRGLLYAGYKECKWQFVIVSGVLFSLMHQNIVQTGYTFFFGVVLALITYYTGSIWGGILIHFVNNGWSVFSSYVSQNGGTFNFINTISDWLYDSVFGMLVALLAVLLCAALLVICLWGMRKLSVKDGFVSDTPFEKPSDEVKPLYKDIPFILTVLVGICATAFSFVWGMTR